MTKEYTDEMRDADDMLLQIRELKKQMDGIESKIDCIATNQAIIIGVLNGTIDIGPFYQQNVEKMH